MKGIEEIRKVIELCDDVEPELDITLARGLNYYTGAIFEVKANDVSIGSVCGGGRYDDLTGVFGLPDVSGVGISFGIDRIYDVMEECNLFNDENLSHSYTQLLFVNFGEAESKYCLELAHGLRKQGFSVEVYPDSVKMKKQMAYADSNKIRYVALAGENELQTRKVTLKNMITGEQQIIDADQLFNHINN